MPLSSSLPRAHGRLLRAVPRCLAPVGRPRSLVLEARVMIPLLDVRDLKKHFVARKSRVVKAVDGVSFALMDNETLGIVGESGCGKSTTASLILQILDPTAGEVFFRGKPLSVMDPPELREY